MTNKRNPPWQAAFLQALSQTANVRAASKLAGVDRRTAQRRRKANEEFSKLWDEALDDAIDLLEQEALRRASTGWDEPVFGSAINGNGDRVTQQVGVIRKYSDRLLEFILKANRPEKYMPPIRQEHSGPGGGPIPYKGDAESFVDAELLRLSEELAAGGGKKAAARPEAAPAAPAVEPEV